MPRRLLALPWLLLLSPLSMAPVLAQSTPTSSADPSTLAEALRALPSDSNLGAPTLLCVDAAGVRPAAKPISANQPDDDDLTVVPSSLADICVRFDRRFAVFGNIAVLAPRTMQVINMPGSIDAGPDSVPLRDAICTLVSSFTPDQWQQAGGPGLSIGDLDDAQREEYTNVVCRPMLVAPGSDVLTYVDNPDGKVAAGLVAQYVAGEKTITTDVARAAITLHIYMTADLRVTHNGTRSLTRLPDHLPTPQAIDYRLSIFDQPKPDQTPTSNIVQTIPSVLKTSDLDWNLPVLSTSVDLRSASTVKDVVAAVSRATGLELHPDPQYGARPVTFLGAPPSKISAVDVLQAIDRDLDATWRRVGPAYVLTDDVVGLGARRYFIRSVIDHNDNMVNDLSMRQADGFDALPLYRWVHFLPGDPVTIPQNVLDRTEQDQDKTVDASSVSQSTVDFLLNQANTLFPTDGFSRDDFRTMSLRLELHLVANIPSFGDVELDPGISFLTYRYKPKPAQDADPSPGAPLDPAILAGHPLSAMAAPSAPDEARHAVDELAKAHVGTFYCPAFYGGETYYPSQTLPPVRRTDASILPAAVEEGKKRGVTVYAVVQLMRWRNGPDTVNDRPLDGLVDEDLTIGGQTARDAWSNIVRTSMSIDSQNDYETLNGVWVSPTDPKTAELLKGIVSEIASTPGIAGVAFVDTFAPGYNHDVGEYSERIQLGYTEGMRLAFLRRYDIDPVDFGVIPTIKLGSTFGGGDLVRMYIDNYLQPENQERDEWDDFRKSVSDAVQADVYAAARSVSPSLPLFVRTGGYRATAFVPISADDKAPDISSRPTHPDVTASIQGTSIVQFTTPMPDYDSYNPPPKPKAGSPIVVDMLTDGSDISAVDRLCSMLTPN